MPQAPLTISQAADAVDLAIQKMWLKDDKDIKEYFRSVYNVTTGVTDLYMKDSSLSGLGNAARVTEQATITSEVPVN